VSIKRAKSKTGARMC